MSVCLFVVSTVISFVVFSRFRHVLIVLTLRLVAKAIFSRDVAICPRFMVIPRHCVSSCVAEISR